MQLPYAINERSYQRGVVNLRRNWGTGVAEEKKEGHVSYGFVFSGLIYGGKSDVMFAATG